jgi:hypothetical protein
MEGIAENLRNRTAEVVVVGEATRKVEVTYLIALLCLLAAG